MFITITVDYLYLYLFLFLFIFVFLNLYKLVYEDGDSEEMSREEVLAALCTDEEVAKLSPSKTSVISQISEEFDFKNPELCFRGILSNPPGGDKSDENNETNQTNKITKSTKSTPKKNKKPNIQIQNRKVINVIDDDDDDDVEDNKKNKNEDENENHEIESIDDIIIDLDDFKDKNYDSHKKKSVNSKYHILLRDKVEKSVSPKKEKETFEKSDIIKNSSDKNDNNINRKRKYNSETNTTNSQLKIEIEKNTSSSSHVTDLTNKTNDVLSPIISISSPKFKENIHSIENGRNHNHYQNGEKNDRIISSTISVCSIDSDT